MLPAQIGAKYAKLESRASRLTSESHTTAAAADQRATKAERRARMLRALKTAAIDATRTSRGIEPVAAVTPRTSNSTANSQVLLV